MRTLKLTVAYDGTNYVGWQRQLNGVSIQQVLEDTLAPMTGTSPGPGIAGAGRTDAGVHAAGQVASVNVAFEHSAGAVLRALNVRLPLDIRVLGVEEAPLGFHARFHARGKSYRYRVATGPILSPFDRFFVWHAPGRRDMSAMQAAAGLLIGRHDFASFQARGSAMQHTVRTVDRLSIEERPDELVFEIAGDGFLRHMARTLVGTLIEVGEGLRTPTSMADVIAAKDRRAAGKTVPASGLTLVAVRYS